MQEKEAMAPSPISLTKPSEKENLMEVMVDQVVTLSFNHTKAFMTSLILDAKSFMETMESTEVNFY